MNSRPEDVLRENRQNGSINYLHIAVTEYRTKTPKRTGFLLAHSLSTVSSLRRGVVGWSTNSVRMPSGDCRLRAYTAIFIFLFSLGASLECLHQHTMLFR